MFKKSVLILCCCVMLSVLLAPAGCVAKTGYTPDGLVTVVNDENEKRVFRIAEVVQNENGQYDVYIRGTEESYACAYAFEATGFAWSVYVDVTVEANDGTVLEPISITPYLTGDYGAVGFCFDMSEAPKSITVSAAGHPDGGVSVPCSELALDAAYAVSDTIVNAG